MANGQSDFERQGVTTLIKYEQARHALGRDEWMAAARASFVPSKRKPCEVCGKYESLAHAHHIRPLAYQWTDGAETPDHAHVWLCPTHHAAIHALLIQSRAKEAIASRHVATVILDICDTDGMDQFRTLFELMKGKA
jgi:hypothetical protein